MCVPTLETTASEQQFSNFRVSKNFLEVIYLFKSDLLRNNLHVVKLTFFKKNFIYLFIYLAVLGFCCCVRAFSSCSERGLLFVAVRRLRTAVASLVAGHWLQAHGFQQLRFAGSRAQAQQLWCTDLVAPRHVGSSRTRA